MKLVKLIPLLLLLLLLTAGAGLAWLLGTVNGARWLISTATGSSGAEVVIGKVEGRLWDRLHLSGVTLSTPGRRLELDRVDLSWKPLALLSGTIGIRELSLRGVRLRDDTPPSDAPPSLAWPRVPDSLGLLDLNIANLRISSLEYRRGSAVPLTVADFQGSLAWEEMNLGLKRFSLVSSLGSLSGSLSAGMKHPSLSAEVILVPESRRTGIRKVSVSSRLAPGTAGEQVAGPFTVLLEGRVNGVGRRLNLSGNLGMTRTGFVFRQLRGTLGGVAGFVSGGGRYDLGEKEPRFSLALDAAGLDLKDFTGQRTDLSGSLSLEGTTRRYRGRFDLSNRGEAWRAARVAGEFRGTGSDLAIAPLRGTLGGGELKGALDLVWEDEVALGGELAVRRMNPGLLERKWAGVVNLDLAFRLERTARGELGGTLDAQLLESRLYGQPLTGRLQAGLSGESLTVDRLDLRGSGFSIHADGDLSRRLNVALHAADLSRLVPGGTGAADARGWLSWHDGRAAGEVVARGERLGLDKLQAGTVSLFARLDREGGQGVNAKVTGQAVSYGDLRADTLQAVLEGSLERHRVAANAGAGTATARISLEGGLTGTAWAGTVTSLSGTDQFGGWQLRGPAGLRVGREQAELSSLAIGSTGGEELVAEASLSFAPLGGSVRSRWSRLNLARFNPWLQESQLSGTGSGELALDLRPGERARLASRASLSGTFSSGGHVVAISRSELQLDGGEQGIDGRLIVQLERGGELKAAITSPVPLGRELPEQGSLAMELRDLDLARLEPWLPETAVVEGRVAANLTGRLLPGRRFDLEGDAAIVGGAIELQRPEGEVSALLRSAGIRWKWRNDRLAGTAAVVFSEGGKVTGRFSLPFDASWPVAARPDGPLDMAFAGRFREQGLLSAVFPELLQESVADLDLDLAVGGTWSRPQPRGSLRITSGGAYIPSAGIRVSDLQVAGVLEQGVLRVDPFRARSGPGTLEGTALVRLDGLRPVSYSATVKGNRFQTVFFPELQIESSPQLTLEGTPRSLKVRGELLLPGVRVTGPPTKGPASPSPDVILEGRPTSTPREPRLEFDVEVRLVLGDRVLVKLEGIDAQLGGSMDLVMGSPERITSRGEIRVVKGRYQTYGVNLDIIRGRLFYAGGPVTRPTLDILALRTVGDVKAGVTVSGTLQAPVVRLYSEPAMPDVDVLAYVVLGHPLGSGSGEQVDLMTRAAGVLLSTGQSAMLQDQIKNRLGLSTLEITTAGRERGYMGYRPIETARPGSSPTREQAGITQAMVTVGKYLTPRLYVSYGRSIFAESNLFLMRYDLFRNWQVETQTGTESGVDLYYKIEFK